MENGLKMQGTELIKHDELTLLGAKWLRKHYRNIEVPNCKEIAVDLNTATKTGEKPDVIGWCSWASVLIESKVSRSDFLAEKKKHFRINPNTGVGNFRYYLVPDGLIDKHEIPDEWGLLYYNPKSGIEIIKVASEVKSNLDCERTILLSLMDRLRKNQ